MAHMNSTHMTRLRGLGSFSYITAVKINKVIEVPKVNPGGFPPTTC